MYRIEINAPSDIMHLILNASQCFPRVKFKQGAWLNYKRSWWGGGAIDIKLLLAIIWHNKLCPQTRGGTTSVRRRKTFMHHIP